VGKAVNGVAVIGSLNIDRTFSVPAIPSPGETVLSTGSIIGLGGKGANQAIAAVRAGAPTSFIGRVGSDGAIWSNLLGDDGVDVSWVLRDDSTVTGSAVISVDPDGENSIVVDLGSNALLEPAHVTDAIESLRPAVALFQLEVPMDAVAAGLEATQATTTTIVNAAPFDPAIVAYFDKIDVLVVNEAEHDMLIGGGADVSAIGALIITRGAAGLDVVFDGISSHVPARVVKAIDTTGAGDTFCGFLAAGLSRGKDLLDACALAASAAALATTRPGASASIPRASDL
jgi:ribokinase